MLKRNEMIQKIADDYGLDMEDPDTYADIVMDSVQPCCCKYCGYITEAEPDCSTGWCDECNKNSCISLSLLMGII